MEVYNWREDRETSWWKEKDINIRRDSRKEIYNYTKERYKVYTGLYRDIYEEKKEWYTWRKDREINMKKR